MCNKQIGLFSCYFACHFYQHLYRPAIYFDTEMMGDRGTYIFTYRGWIFRSCELRSTKTVSSRPVPDMLEKGIVIKHISRKQWWENQLEDIVVNGSRIWKWILNRIFKLGLNYSGPDRGAVARFCGNVHRGLGLKRDVKILDQFIHS